MRLTKKFCALLIVLVILLIGGNFFSHHDINRQKDSGGPNYPLGQADSIWAIVNKGRVLPSDYSPTDLVTPDVPLALDAQTPQMQLRIEAAKALEKLVGAAAKQNIGLVLSSGYRSYDTQVVTYQSEVDAYGVAKADAESARPGYSEHQTGLAADLSSNDNQCQLQDCFADTAAGRWLAANAYRYGYVIRYQRNTTSLTGYEFEPWHLRYVGAYLAARTHSSGQTLERYFKLPVYPDYSTQPLKLK